MTFKEYYERASIYAKKQGWIDTNNYFVNNPDSITDNGKYALLSAVWFWNSQINKSKNVNFRNKYCCEIANDETNGNVATTRKAGKKEIHTIKSVLAISVSVNGGTNGLDDRTKQHTRIKSQNIFKDF